MHNAGVLCYQWSMGNESRRQWVVADTEARYFVKAISDLHFSKGFPLKTVQRAYKLHKGFTYKLSEAIGWFEKAALKGYHPSMYNVGRMSFDRDGVRPGYQNEERAYYWFTMYQLYSRAYSEIEKIKDKQLVKKAILICDFLFRNMPKSQVEQALKGVNTYVQIQANSGNFLSAPSLIFHNKQMKNSAESYMQKVINKK